MKGCSTKRCVRCRKDLPREAFSLGRSRCKACRSEIQAEKDRAKYANDAEFRAKCLKKKRSKANLDPVVALKSHLERHYNMSLEEYQAKLLEQRGVCAVCGLPPVKGRLAVDHNHETGENRGLIHRWPCNVLIGIMERFPTIVTLGVRYLRRYGNKGLLDTGRERLDSEQTSLLSGPGQGSVN